MRMKSLLAMIVCAVVIASPALADRIFDEPFDYTPDPINGLHGTGGWVIMAFLFPPGGYPVVQAGSLSYPGYGNSGNKGVLPAVTGTIGTIAKDAPAELAAEDGTVLYFSSLFGENGEITLMGSRVFPFVDWGINIVGYLTTNGLQRGDPFESGTVLGRVENLAQILRDEVIDEVVFAVDSNFLPHLQPKIRLCEEQGVDASVVTDVFKPNIARAKIRDFYGI